MKGCASRVMGRSREGAALFRRLLSRSFIRVYGRGYSLSSAVLRGDSVQGYSPPSRLFSDHPARVGPGAGAPRCVFSGVAPGHSRGVFVRCRWEGRHLLMALAPTKFGTCVQREGSDADRRGRAGVFGLEPDGAGAHGVRVAAVAAAERAAEGAGGAGSFSSGSMQMVRWCCRTSAGAARSVQSPAFPTRRRGSRGPAGGQRARRRAAGVRAGARACPAPAVPGNWWDATTTLGTR